MSEKAGALKMAGNVEPKKELLGWKTQRLNNESEKVNAFSALLFVPASSVRRVYPYLALATNAPRTIFFGGGGILLKV